MNVRQLLIPLFACTSVALALAPAPAHAAEPDSIDAESATPHVYQGTPVQTCGWPTAVAVTSGGGLCTGTLVHPRVVIYAAHCGGGNKTIRFGENAFQGGNGVGASCQTYSGWSGSEGTDWAYCVLNQDVDLPITPVLYGCEMDALAPLSEVAVVGFGKNTANGGSGTKRWGLTTLQAVNHAGNTTALGGGGEPSVCPGDSGGPAFIKGDDGVWRVFGIASTVQVIDGSDCGGQGNHSLVTDAVPWVEESSGYDITPCHDVEGNWDPGPDCGGFFGSGANTYGSWGNWCAGTPASPLAATCGPDSSTAPETNAPDIVITSPADGYTSAEVPTNVDIDFDVSDDTGYLSVWLQIDGEDFLNQIDTEPPWSVNNVAFPKGTYTLRGVAEDYWGNQAVSAPITIAIGEQMPPPTPTDEGGEGEGEGEGEGGSDDSDDSGGDEGIDTGFDTGLGDGGFGFDGGDSESGCACAASSDWGSGGLAGLSLLLLALGVRRRERD